MCYECFVCVDQRNESEHKKTVKQREETRHTHKKKHLEISTPHQMDFYVQKKVFIRFGYKRRSI